nr:hypothetical protein [uncultured Flavobacterium sp.]
MKLKLTLFSIFIVLGLHAQKQIQPYNFSVSDKDKTETIMIYAAASSANNLTFTLKNAKDEVLLDKEGKEISFQVFPFTEVSFGNHLIDAINDVENYDIIKERITYLKDNPTSQKQNIAVQDVRNIYQFFNALVTTAFAYDTEPVAGVLKYSLNTTIAKKNIEGQDADLYFLKNAKHLRKHIICHATCKKDTSEFVEKVFNNSEHKKLFEEFHENTKGPNTYKAKVKFKHYAEKKLKELYNVYQIQGYWQEDFLSDYIFYKKCILSLEEVNTNKKILIDKNIKKIEAINRKMDSIAKPYNNLVFERNIISENYKKAKNKEDELKNRKIAIDISNKENPTTELNNESVALQNLIRVMQDSIKYYYERRLADYNLRIPVNPSNAKNEIDNFNAEITESRVIIKLNEGEIKIIQNYIDNLISKNRLKIKKLPLWNFNVETIEIDINDGFIEHITAVGKVKLPFIDENLIRSFDQKKTDNGDYDRIKEML